MRRWLRRSIYALAIAAYFLLWPQPEAAKSGEPQLALVQFLVLLAIQAVLFLAAQLLTPKPEIEDARPKGLGDFNFPSATEGRQIPVVWGTVEVKGPNVIWFGDLRVKEIKEKVKTGLFSSDKVTVGFRYFVGMDMAICYGQVDALRRIKVGTETAVAAGTYASPGAAGGTAIVINKPSLFGGEKKGGGLNGTLRFYNGYSNQTQNSYLVSKLGASAVPGYVDLCHAVWEQGEIGESENIEPWAFEVSRWPNQLGLTSNRHKIGEDANPACVLYEILTDEVYGLDVDPGDIDTASFVAAGNTLSTEANGFSYVLDRTQAARDVIKEVLRQIDGLIYQDPGSGKHVLKLMRADFDPMTLPQFDETNVLAVENYSRASWSQTQNNVEIQYADRAKDYVQTSARAQDLANVRILDGQQVLSQMSFPGVKTGALANTIAARELRQLSYPLAKARLTATREAASLKPGDVIKWSWQRYGVSNLVMRVTNVGLGDLVDGRVTIDCFEDVFSLGTAIFDPAAPTNWSPIANLPTAATIELVRSLPYWFVLVDPASGGEPVERTMSLVARPTGVCVSYDVWTNTGPSGAYERVSESTPFTPTATLVNAYAEDTADVDTAVEIIVQSVVDAEDIAGASAADIETFGLGLALIQGATALEDEIIGFEGFTDLGGGQYRLETVHRGLLDTLPRAHSAGARIWFFSGVAGVSSLRFFDPAQTVSGIKHRTQTTNRDLDLADAATLSNTFNRRTTRLLPPGGATFNSARYPNPRIDEGDVTVAWKHRHRLDPKILDQNDPDSTLGLESGGEYRLVFKELPSGSTIRTQVQTGTSYTYTRAQQTTDNGGVPPQKLRVELDARLTADPTNTASRIQVVREFEVFTLNTRSVDLDGSTEVFLKFGTSNMGFANRWTIGGWLKRMDADTAERTVWIIGPGVGGANAIVFTRLGATSTAYQVRVYDSAGAVIKSLIYDLGWTANVWTHFMFTFDGDASGDPLVVYRDGVAQTFNSFLSTDGTGTMTDSPNRAVQISIGASGFVGRMYDFAAWSVPLSAAAVAAIHAGGRAFNLNLNQGSYTSATALQLWYRYGRSISPIDDILKDYSIYTTARPLEFFPNIDASDFFTDAPA